MNILLAGATGAMGKVVTEVVKENEKDKIVAGFAHNSEKLEYPVYK